MWLALPLKESEKIQRIQSELEDTATSVYLVPDFFGLKLASYHVDFVAGTPVMHMSTHSIEGFNGAVKRLMDFTAALLALLILSPLLLATAALIKLESKGPVFFKQRRYGQDGRIILVWKFRSMTVTEDSDVVTQATKNDSRVTKVGAVIRKFSIDELPQLINVLLGNMSLVGPRPHAVAHNEYYRKKVPGYMVRHQIKPGITGLAQVNGCRGETREICDMEKRVKYDLEYIRNWSVMLDIWIILKTVGTLFNVKNTY